MSAVRGVATIELPSPAERGMRCASCFARVCAEIESLEGVQRVECDPRGSVRVEYDGERVSVDDIETTARNLGAQLEGVYRHGMWRIEGLDCPDCARTLAKSVEMIPGVEAAELNFASATLLVEHRPDVDPCADVEATVRLAGHSAEPLAGTALDAARPAEPGAGVTSGFMGTVRSWTRAHRTETAVLGSGASIILGWLLGLLGRAAGAPAWLAPASAVAFVIAILFGESLLGPRALASIRARSLDMNVLMTIAVVGAAAIGQLEEAATVVFLFALGGWLEARALARTRNSIRDLMDLAPDTVQVERGDGVVVVAPAEVAVGDSIVIRPGERIALDGEITSGVSAIDEAAVTGEPVPAEKSVRDRVFSGSLNGSGVLRVRVTSRAEDSTLARIVYLVEEAQATRAPSQLLVDRFSRIYTPVAVGIAVAVAVVPPLVGLAMGSSAPAELSSWSTWLYRGLVVLVAACPCALVISTPVTFVSAIARAGRDGVLVKGGAYLEVVSALDAVAFDKTGTLTEGRPRVTDVTVMPGVDRAAVVSVAVALEAHSTHPLAAAVIAYGDELGVLAPTATDLEELPGRGVRGTVEGRACELVSPTFAEEIADVPSTLATAIAHAESNGRTVLVLAEDGVALGFFGVEDPVRTEARAAVESLQRAGIGHLVMLTGDNERTAAAVAARVGLPAHMARLLPEDKVDAIVRVKDRYGVTAMVGDGINDAPALAAADLGIAMGAAGSDTALETADVALLGDDLRSLPRLVALGKRTVGIVRANVVFSVAAKLAVLIAAVLGHANMWLAVFADTGVALIVIANGMRLLGGPSAGGARAAAKSVRVEGGQ